MDNKNPFYKTDAELKKLASKHIRTYQLFGFDIIVYPDVTLENHTIYEFSGKDYFDKNSVYEAAKKCFLETNFQSPFSKDTVYIVAHAGNNSNELYYEAGLYDGTYNATYNIYEAKWFNSKQELFNFLDGYCYFHKTVVLEYTKKSLQLSVNLPNALKQMRKL